MRTPMIKKYLWMMAPFLFFIFSMGYADAADDGVHATTKNANTLFDYEEVFGSVLHIQDNTVPVIIKQPGRRFRTETRKDKMERFRCSACHNNKEVKITRAAETAHGDIINVHGRRGQPLACFACHKEDERDFLVNENGLRIDMDHSYQMCSRCHFRESRDWIGGAHGKRVAYWAGERVVRNCTSCHNPHSPRFEKRWPKTYSPPFR
jgi:formate-dependent nitrite reductase cytochrome c552 subunit